jgi:hypothetical protein
VDDYPVVSLDQIADNAESTMKIFRSSIGGAVDWGSYKDVKLSTVFTALGARIVLMGLASHPTQVSNKQSRVEALQQVIGNVLRAGTLMPEMARRSDEWPSPRCPPSTKQPRGRQLVHSPRSRPGR